MREYKSGRRGSTKKGVDGIEAAQKLYGGGAPQRERVTRRVPFDPSESFHELRRRCIAAGKRFGEPYRSLLARLESVEPLTRHASEENRGASYRRLAKAAHLAGFSEAERKNLYWIAEKVGMSDRFAGHLIASLKREGEADE